MRVKDERKIEVIYEATLHLIQEVGIAGITVAKIAKEAKLATGTVYIYFKNKEELINQLYLHLKKQTTENLFVGFDPTEPIKVCMKKLFVNALKNKMASFKEGVFMEQYYHSPYISQEQNK
ncbi:TetR/AcrR family transcriptional regulator [Microscilla marina]|uniref:Transcriptional regulator, TetR family n=1 Tax=Microscilla marina ATCC 23134 TaxID=313606 RepID=A1ZL45_MICM2|nr:TetR/AcrR family transcriptional regulator [Microscilla marina]EAY29011.1 transcriptional regulator, TetR family [Microscilla marina ATCC 23134]